MTTEQLYQAIEKDVKFTSPEILSIKNIIYKYPYFQAPIFIYLKYLYLNDSEKFNNELSHLSIFIKEREALFYYIFNQDYDKFFQQTKIKKLKEDKTNILLSKFFESDSGEKAETYPKFEYDNISIASSDYFSFTDNNKSTDRKETEKEKTISPLKHQGIIDTFISKSKEDGGIKIKIEKGDSYISDENIINNINSTEGDELDEDIFFTETLAKIYIKQKKYEKAYKIIKHLSLNYPKKNIYFADQLSFLEKLIINSKFKDTK